MEDTGERQLWNVVPEVPEGRLHMNVSPEDSCRWREERQAEINRLDATLKRNCQVSSIKAHIQPPLHPPGQHKWMCFNIFKNSTNAV
jgi:hypothetical protein